MNLKLLLPISLLAAAAAMVTFTGCKQAAEPEVQDETKITGKPTDPPVLVRAKWRPGWNYQFFVQSQQSADLGFGRMRGGGAAGANESGMETTVKQDLAVTVTNGPQETLDLVMELQSLGLTVFMGNETVAHYDSAQQTASGQAEQLAPMLDKIVGGHFKCVLDDRGKLKEVEGVRELLEEATAAGPDAANAGAGGPNDRRGGRRGGMFGMMGLTMLQRMLNDSYFRPLVEFPSPPAEPLRVGQTWTHQQDMTAMAFINISVLTTNTFKGWQYRDGHKCARIEVSGIITQAKQQGEGGGAGGFDLLRMLGNLSFDDAVVNGTIWVDPALEFPVEVSMSQSFKISGTMPNWGGMGGMGGRPNRGGVDPAAAAAAATAMGGGERFSRPVSMNTLMKLRSATGPQGSSDTAR